MKQLAVERTEIDLQEYKLRSAQESDYSTLITEDALIFEDGVLMAAVLQLPFDTTDIVNACQRIKYDTGTRTDGMVSRSAIFGFNPRNTLRKDFCSATRMAYEQPDEHAVIIDYAGKVAEYYQQVNPTLFSKHHETTEEHVIKDYRVKQSPFTSGIVNKNNPLKYHFDSGNFADVWSCMLVFKRDVEGGYLSIPEYDMGFELKHNTLFMFDGQGLLHGVTPIKRTQPDAFRYSIVYYSLRQMWNCDPIDDELIRIRKLKTKREKARTKARTKDEFKR